MVTKYTVRIEGSSQVQATVEDGPTAYNTARAIAHAVARINPGVVVELHRQGRAAERYIGRERTAVDVERATPRAKRRDSSAL